MLYYVPHLTTYSDWAIYLLLNPSTPNADYFADYIRNKLKPSKLLNDLNYKFPTPAPTDSPLHTIYGEWSNNNAQTNISQSINGSLDSIQNTIINWNPTFVKYSDWVIYLLTYPSTLNAKLLAQYLIPLLTDPTQISALKAKYNL